MVHTLTAHTAEVDQKDAAVQEILQQLNLEKNLRKNTVGVVACHYEFVLSGVAQAICESLPFETAGSITALQAVPGEMGTFMFTIMVLTSDDTSFQTVLTDSLLGSPATAIEAAYQAASTGRDAAPALILSFAGFMVENSGDEYVNVITRVSGGAPCFGTLSVDNTTTFEYCYMLHNGRHYRDRMAMILLYGDLAPDFYIATLSQDKLIDRAALVTSSDGHILKELNGRPVVEFFEDLGVAQALETGYAMTSLPFMLDYGDGTPPVSKVFISLNEDRHAICAGAMPEGSTLYIGVFDKDDVLLTTRKAVQAALAGNPQPRGILIYSCISRNMSLGAEPQAELELVRDAIGGTAPFLMAYSGGEMCPTQISEKIAINRFHNNAFVFCIF